MTFWRLKGAKLLPQNLGFANLYPPTRYQCITLRNCKDCAINLTVHAICSMSGLHLWGRCEALQGFFLEGETLERSSNGCEDRFLHMPACAYDSCQALPRSCFAPKPVCNPTLTRRAWVPKAVGCQHNYVCVLSPKGMHHNALCHNIKPTTELGPPGRICPYFAVADSYEAFTNLSIDLMPNMHLKCTTSVTKTHPGNC